MHLENNVSVRFESQRALLVLLGGRYSLGLLGEEGDDEPPYHIFYSINL